MFTYFLAWTHQNQFQILFRILKEAHPSLSTTRNYAPVNSPGRKGMVNQEQHHKKVTFRDEYIQFLKKFEIDYDERFLFDFLEDIEQTPDI